MKLLVSKKGISQRWGGMHTAHVVSASSDRYSVCGRVAIIHPKYEMVDAETVPGLTTVCEACIRNTPTLRRRLYRGEDTCKP